MTPSTAKKKWTWGIVILAIIFVFLLCLCVAPVLWGNTPGGRAYRTAFAVTRTAKAWTPTPIPTNTPVPSPTPARIATIVYRDGRMMTLENWFFKYIFGHSDTEPKGVLITYTPQKKESKTLWLQLISDSKSQILIEPNQLSQILFFEQKPPVFVEPKPCSITGTEIRTKSGDNYLFGSSSGCKLDEIARLVKVDIPDWFLSNKKYVFGKEVFLVGWITDDKGQRQEITLEIKCHYACPNTAEEVEMIIFP